MGLRVRPERIQEVEGTSFWAGGRAGPETCGVMQRFAETSEVPVRRVTGSSAAGERRMEIRRMVIGRLRDLALIPALVAMGAVFSLTTSDFLTQQNLLNILQQNAVLGIAAIGATFFVGIIALQTLLRPLTAGSELSVAISTLASFALFQPIRRRVQGTVDRHFDRSRYDAARTLDVFAERLRDEVELDALRDDLLGAVQQTMAPEYVSVWLRPWERAAPNEPAN